MLKIEILVAHLSEINEVQQNDSWILKLNSPKLKALWIESEIEGSATKKESGGNSWISNSKATPRDAIKCRPIGGMLASLHSEKNS